MWQSRHWRSGRWSDGLGGASRCDGVPVWHVAHPPEDDDIAPGVSWQPMQCRLRGLPHDPPWLRGGFVVWHSVHWSVVWQCWQRSRAIDAASPWPGPFRQKLLWSRGGVSRWHEMQVVSVWQVAHRSGRISDAMPWPAPFRHVTVWSSGGVRRWHAEQVSSWWHRAQRSGFAATDAPCSGPKRNRFVWS